MTSVFLRPRDGRVIAGVCAALARRFGMDASLVRLVFFLAFFLLGAGLVAYLLLWLMIPEE
jgi:phage shock protein PspC (stress-responsive transcriptional regulator)